MKGNLEWFADLGWYVRFRIIWALVWILSTERGVFSLDENFFSGNFRFGYTLSNTSLIVMFRLTGSIDGSESRLESELDKLSSFVLFPSCPVKDRRNFQCFLHFERFFLIKSKRYTNSDLILMVIYFKNLIAETNL